MQTTIKDIKINYEQYGQGSDVLILHGWGADINAVLPIFNGLKDRFNVYALDLPGFGKSDMPKETYTVYDYADLVEQFIVDHKIVNPIIIGHSFGGRLAIILRGKNRLKINKLILVDSAGVKPKRGIDYYFKVYTYKFCKILVKPFGQKTLNKVKSMFGSTDYKNADPTLRTVMVRVVNEDLTYLFDKVDVPTLLMWGEKDMATPLSDAKIMEKHMPDAGIVVLKGAGHFSYLDNPRQFMAVVDKFLENDARRV